ncbi:MAG: hypothetical protein CM1200mP13_08620 [Candidatus Pelagibacterales bacterium]|nr:MAG: hypothetical protein CM1200mP13_08620 [Pelagibacterales bacterium]
MANVAGAAPDIFTAAGQIWGNPLYLWEEHKKENYKWWIDRLNSCLSKYELLRKFIILGVYFNFGQYLMADLGLKELEERTCKKFS